VQKLLDPSLRGIIVTTKELPVASSPLTIADAVLGSLMIVVQIIGTISKAARNFKQRWLFERDRWVIRVTIVATRELSSRFLSWERKDSCGWRWLSQ